MDDEIKKTSSIYPINDRMKIAHPKDFVEAVSDGEPKKLSPSETAPTTIQEILPEKEWKERMTHHHRKLEPWVIPHLKRHELDQEHAVYDFLFSYYSFRTSLLMRWSPGIAFLLAGQSASDFLKNADYTRFENNIGLDPKQFPQDRMESAEWILNLIEKTTSRPVQLGCSGLHEWAMEFENKTKRYPQIPLRMSPNELKEFVLSQNVCCTHYDAFRFFTPSAVPLNHLNPTKKTQPDFEQRGCLHVNMDLYKWAYKFYPWISSELIAETFFIALEAREIDMRASPYDLSHLGFSPLCIETSAGRTEYQNLQSEISEKAQPVREKLTQAYRQLIDWAKSHA
jgi:hypothetical protein